MAEKRSSRAEEAADREIVVTRVVDAPRELVWKAWTYPEHVVHWWGPTGFTTSIETMDVKPGGVWKHVMHGPDGTDYPNKSVFTEVVAPERIAYSHGGGRKGGPGVRFRATWTFEAQGERTKVTIRILFDTATDRDIVVKEYGAIEGSPPVRYRRRAADVQCRPCWNARRLDRNAGTTRHVLGQQQHGDPMIAVAALLVRPEVMRPWDPDFRNVGRQGDAHVSIELDRPG